MISQSDTTLSPATTTTNNKLASPPHKHSHHHHHHHHNHHKHSKSKSSECRMVEKHHASDNNNHIQDFKHSEIEKEITQDSVLPQPKKKKRFDETIIDGFAIEAFRSWEDLQDELNERSSDANNNTESASNNESNEPNSASFTAKKFKHNNLTSSTATTTTSITTVESDTTANSKIKGTSVKKLKTSAGHNSSSHKEKRVKVESNKTSLRKALEAKELAEKRLSILQEKLKQEQNRNRRGNEVEGTDTPPQQESSDINPTETRPVIRNENLVRSNTHLHVSSDSKQLPYTPFAMSNQLSQSCTAIQTNSKSDPSTGSDMFQHQRQYPIHQQLPPKHPSMHSPYMSNPQPPPLHQVQLSPSPSVVNQTNASQIRPPLAQTNHPAPPLPFHQAYSGYNRLQQSSQMQNQPMPNPSSVQVPLPAVPSFSPHLFNHNHPTGSHPHPPPQYPHPSAAVMSLGSGAYPSPYNCAPSIYITDTISRQTSIIPTPSLGNSNLESSTSAARFGHSNVLPQPINPYTPSVAPTPPQPHHNSMYYQSFPSDRSFIEFARNYSGPSHHHLNYPALMGSFPGPPTPGSISNGMNPYNGFDRWPRTSFDHQRSANRFNSLYQTTTVLPDRTYATHASATRSVFPAGIFQPPF